MTSTATNPQALEVLADAIPTTDPDRLFWAQHVREGIEAREQHDGAAWRLGYLAASVETTYGDGSLQKYAEEIGVEYDSLVRYRQVARKFGDNSRFAGLSFSHHREVAALDDADSWLQRAADGKWSVARLREKVHGRWVDLIEERARAEAAEVHEQVEVLRGLLGDEFVEILDQEPHLKIAWHLREIADAPAESRVALAAAYLNHNEGGPTQRVISPSIALGKRRNAVPAPAPSAAKLDLRPVTPAARESAQRRIAIEKRLADAENVLRLVDARALAVLTPDDRRAILQLIADLVWRFEARVKGSARS